MTKESQAQNQSTAGYKPTEVPNGKGTTVEQWTGKGGRPTVSSPTSSHSEYYQRVHKEMVKSYLVGPDDVTTEALRAKLNTPVEGFKSVEEIREELGLNKKTE